MTGAIVRVNWIIPTVRKHIVPQEPLPRACVAVSIDEPLDYRIVISGLQVIEARLFDGVVAVEAKMRSI